MNVKGENGTTQVSSEGVGSPGLALFNKLIRCAKPEELRPLLEAYVVDAMDADEERQSVLVEDLFVLVFQTRDVLKGKGERDLFYELVLLLFRKFPRTVLALVKYIPQFGYWKDLLRIIHFIDKRVEGGDYNVEDYAGLRGALLDLFAEELKSAGEKDKVTLSGKWAPREGSMYDKIAAELAAKIFPEQSGTYQMRSYRKLICKLTRVVEQQMSAKKFAEIQFEHVPSKAMQRYKKTFLKGSETDEDRQKCRENMEKFLADVAEGKATMKTKTLMPHEVCAEALKYANQLRWDDRDTPQRRLARKMAEVLDLQWEGIVDKFINDICEECKAPRESVVDILQHSVALSDVSGSMSGIPMDVSIGLGVLIAQFCKAFPETLITFQAKPAMFKVTGKTLSERVVQVAEMPWGGNTDFLAALRLMLEAAQKENIAPADFPKIMFVFSDMQFDAAVGNGYSSEPNLELRKKYSSNHEILVNDFKQAGYDVPLIIYWNLRAGTPGHETSADVEGTVMLSGYNPTLLKSVFSGQDLSKLNFETFKKSIDPQKVYDNVVSSKNYLCIRETVRGMKDVWVEELMG